MSPRALDRLVAPIRRRLSLMVGRCVVNLVNDAAMMQGVQVSLLADEVIDGVERLQSYGFTAHPLAGAEAVMLSIGGVRTKTMNVVIACDDRRYRLTGLASGEVAMYTDQGDKIVIKRGGTIEVTAATKLLVHAPIDTDQHLKVGGTKVVGAQGAAVPDAAGGVTVDAEARAAINTLLARCRAHGLIA